MDTGTEFAKCTMWEGEDMSGKTDVSDVYLTMYVRQPVSGVCSESGTLVSSVIDDSYDIRHMVNTDTSLAGNCLQVKVWADHVTSSGTTVSVFCYSAGEEDNED